MLHRLSPSSALVLNHISSHFLSTQNSHSGPSSMIVFTFNISTDVQQIIKSTSTHNSSSTQATYMAHTRGDGRRNRLERSPQQSLVGCSIKQVLVAAMIACSVHMGRLSRQLSRHHRCGDDCRNNRRNSRLVHTLEVIVAPTVAATIALCIRPIRRCKYIHFPWTV